MPQSSPCDHHQSEQPRFDEYDALISRRVYKPPFPHEQALEMIAAEKGRHFDPDLVDALMRVAGDFAAIARNFRDEPEDEEGSAAAGAA